MDTKAAALVSGTDKVELKASGEEGILMIKALLGMGDMVTNVNLPNRGQASDLPRDSVVETNACFGRDSIRPVLAGTLPSDVRSLVLRHVMNQETTLSAALAKDKEMAFRAFINDPLVTIDPTPARELFTSMLANTKAYLPGWEI